MTNFILGVFEITVGMSLFIAFLFLALKIFGSKFTAKCRYILWSLVMLRLAIPFSMGIVPSLIEIPVETVLVQDEEASFAPMETTAPSTKPQPSDLVETMMPSIVPNTSTVPTAPSTPSVDSSSPILSVETAEGGNALTEPIVEDTTETEVSWEQILDIAGIVYLAVAAVFLVWNLGAYVLYTGKILRSAKSADDDTQRIFRSVCKKYGVGKPPMLLVSSAIHSPAAFGILRRRIVLPDIAFTENGLVGILAHEVTHCKRRDLYVKMVELIACSLNWFNPLVHIAAFQCEKEMELSCDEKVLAGSNEATRSAYAEVMLDIIHRCRRHQGTLTTHFNPKKSAVAARFKNILYGSGKHHGRLLIAVCLVLCAVAGTIVACRTGEELPNEHWYAEGCYLKCDNGSDVIVMDADGPNSPSPCHMIPADDSVSFEGLTDGDRIKIEILTILTIYPGQTEVYSIEKLSDGSPDDIDTAVLDNLRELGWMESDAFNQNEVQRYLSIPKITLTPVEVLPYSVEAAVFTASPVGGQPIVYFFDTGLTFYIQTYLYGETDSDKEYYKGTLTLPNGVTDGAVIHASRGGGSGEVDIFVKAALGNEPIYLDYFFNWNNENFLPAGVGVLDEVQIRWLMETMVQISTTQITEYKFDIPLEDKLDYIVPAAIYGEIHPYVNPDRYAPSIQTNEYSPDGVGYITFGIANDMKPSNVFSRCYTYRITQKGGCIVSVEEVETITKETVLQNGTPYSGNYVGNFIGITYNCTRTATVSGNDISVSSYQSHTDAGGTYVGTYSYDAEIGDFSAELAFQYHDNGNFITNDPETISGKLYEYGGFIHFVCTSSNISTVNVNDTLPITFSVSETENQENISVITDIADWELLPWSESWERWGIKPASNTYNFIYNLVSGESKIPEYNGLGIQDYSITLVEDEGSGIGTTMEFTFTVTGNSLPETLLPGTYSWILCETMNLYVYTENKPTTQEEYDAYDNKIRGLDRFEDNSAVQAVNEYLRMKCNTALWKIPSYGKWTAEEANSLYNYICKFYGDENMQIDLNEMLKLLREKFGYTVQASDIVWRTTHCNYDAESNIVRFADTRNYEFFYRFLDIREENGVTEVIVQLFADRHNLLPSHKVRYRIGEGEVFLGCEVIQEGNYAPYLS